MFCFHELWMRSSMFNKLIMHCRDFWVLYFKPMLVHYGFWLAQEYQRTPVVIFIVFFFFKTQISFFVNSFLHFETSNSIWCSLFLFHSCRRFLVCLLICRNSQISKQSLACDSRCACSVIEFYPYPDGLCLSLKYTTPGDPVASISIRVNFFLAALLYVTWLLLPLDMYSYLSRLLHSFKFFLYIRRLQPRLTTEFFQNSCNADGNQTGFCVNLVFRY